MVVDSFCHFERSEKSCFPSSKMLHCAQNDKSKTKLFAILYSLLIIISASAQEGTRNAKEGSSVSTGKIMLVPFEPKLYMSEIDQKVNQQTGWKFDQIRENFRHQLDTQLQIKLNKMEPVVSFYSDSLKMAKDLDYIYKTTSLSYDPVDKKNVNPAAPAKQKGIKNGQIVVEMNNDKKFMNKKINDPELITYLNKKYKTEYFIFINELDITSDINSYDIATDSYQRIVTVHYSIIDKFSKTINAGIASSKFTSKENNPKKIVNLSFSPVANYIANKLSETILQKSTPSSKN